MAPSRGSPKEWKTDICLETTNKNISMAMV